jgi:hypothetical protein
VSTGTRKKGKQTHEKHAASATDDLLAILVLDESGSMGWLTNDTVKGVDDYVAGLRDDAAESGSDTLVSITAFASRPGQANDRHWHVAESAEKIPSIEGRYHPTGGTPLYDAMAHSLIEAEKALEKMGRPDMKVLHVTVTDGGENSSSDYPRDASGSNAELAAMIRERTFLGIEERKTLDAGAKVSLIAEREAADDAQGNWTFVYLGASHASVEHAQAFAASAGYTPGNATLYSATPMGTSSTFSSLRAASVTRKHDEAASSGHFFADAGQSAADYLDPNASVAPQGIVQPNDTNNPLKPKVPETGDVAAETGLKTGSINDLLGGGK